MTPWLDYFWPSFALGVVIAAIAATYAWRRRPGDARRIAGGAIAVAVLGALAWSGPLGAADRFTGMIERQIDDNLTYYEMTQVNARLDRAPLTRQIVLKGPADDFQRSELVRVLSELPGVSGARWERGGGALPIVAEGVLAALAGLLLGWFLAYLLELHRRHNAQWDW